MNDQLGNAPTASGEFRTLDIRGRLGRRGNGADAVFDVLHVLSHDVADRDRRVRHRVRRAARENLEFSYNL